MKHLAQQYFSTKYHYLLLVPVALLMFPHKGIVHDSRLYVFDILNIARDGIFANDFVTIAGAQNKYTLFAYLAAPLYGLLTPWAAATVTFIVGQLLWFSGLIALVAKFAEDEKTAFFGLLSAFLLPATYFGFSVLSYGEPFVTPRLFVEGVTFWSLWCFFSRRYLLSVLLVAIAFSLHPIMGLIAASLLIATLLQEGRRWWWIFGAAAVAGAAILVGSGAIPLERLTAALAGDWLRVVETRAKYLYVSQWPIKDWARILLATSITIPLIALYSGWQRKLIISAWVVAGAGLMVSFLGTDVLHNVLLSQVQSSRAVWFIYLLGNIGLGVVVANLYNKTEADGDAFLILYVLVWTVTHLFWPLPGLVLGLAASGLAYLRLTDKITGLPSIFRRLIYLTAILLFSWLFFFRIKFWLEDHNRDGAIQNGDGFLGISGFTHIELIFAAFLIFVAVRLRLRIPAYATKGLLIVLAVWSVLVWDRRNMENRGLEGEYVADTLREHIPEGAQVYWEGDSKGTWFLLRRPSYFSGTQGAGVVFSEALAVAFWNRSRVAQAIDGVDYVDIWHPSETLKERKERERVLKQLQRSDIIAACATASELDFLVLTRPVDGAYLTVWHPRTRAQVANAPAASPALQPTQPLYLYRCADFR